MWPERKEKGRGDFIIISGDFQDFPRAFLTVFNYFGNLWSIDVASLRAREWRREEGSLDGIKSG